MKVSDWPLLSASDDLRDYDFPSLLKFDKELKTFKMSCVIYSSYDGDDFYEYYGSYEDCEESQTLTLYLERALCDDRSILTITPIRKHVSTYKFDGNRVTFDKNPWGSVFKRGHDGSVSYFYTGFVEHSQCYSDTESV
jgi:hypothetical protein